MKTIQQIRSMTVIATVLFAAILSGCKKTDVAPANNGNPPAATLPTTPVQPPSVKPGHISTISDGVSVREQTYIYDSNQNLQLYISKSASSLDSVEFGTGTATIKVHTSSSSILRKEILGLNSDKTYGTLIFSRGATEQNFFFRNSNERLDRLIGTNSSGTPVTLMEVSYLDNELSTINAEVLSININYYSSLPYQKGINEIPFALGSVKYYKLLEAEGKTHTFLYDKLIHQVTIQSSASTFELHEFVYQFDSQNRVTQITDTVTKTTSTSSSQKVLVSTVSY